MFLKVVMFNKKRVLRFGRRIILHTTIIIIASSIAFNIYFDGLDINELYEFQKEFILISIGTSFIFGLVADWFENN